MKPNIQTMNEDDYWDCPCCGQPTPPEDDKECHCGMRVSHHLSVSTLCKQLRQAQQRESTLIVQNKKLENEVNEQARLLGMSAERECDLRGILERERILADKLADSLLSTFSSWVMSPKSEKLAKCLATWKEARNES